MSKFNSLMLAKLFMNSTSINGACGGEEELREKFYSELYKATAVATDGETTFVDTPEFVAIITVYKHDFNNNAKKANIVDFDIITKDDTMVKYNFFFNKSSVIDLGNHLRTVKRVDMKDFF